MTDLIEQVRSVADEHLAFEANEIVHKAADELAALEKSRDYYKAEEHRLTRLSQDQAAELERLRAIAEAAEDIIKNSRTQIDGSEKIDVGRWVVLAEALKGR